LRYAAPFCDQVRGKAQANAAVILRLAQANGNLPDHEPAHDAGTMTLPHDTTP
jgi:hypothetical protein